MEFSTSKCKEIQQCRGLKSIQESKLAFIRAQLSSSSCLVAFSKEKTAQLKVPYLHEEVHRSVSVWSQASPHPPLTLFFLWDVRGKTLFLPFPLEPVLSPLDAQGSHPPCQPRQPADRNSATVKWAWWLIFRCWGELVKNMNKGQRE